jgi:hypothetical protein
VLSNLLNNAAKYTAPGGTIELSADQAGGEVVIAVVDNGMGFPPELARQIFEPFAQWAPAQHSAAGLGIGLSLVRGIVELHGGAVSAVSEGPGKGSRFEVRLPLAGEAPAVAAHAAAAPAKAPPGVRVLVADDNRDAADTLSRILSMYGYEVRSATTAARRSRSSSRSTRTPRCSTSACRCATATRWRASCARGAAPGCA